VLKNYRNGFINIIREHGLDPANFHAEDSSVTRELTDGETTEESVFTIQFMATGLKFTIRNPPYDLHSFNTSWTRFDVGFPEAPVFVRPDFEYPQDIGKVYEWFVYWLLHEVQVYIDEMTLPDLWQQIEQQKQLVPVDPLTDYETSPFTEPEKQQLRAAMEQFRVLMRQELKPTQGQLEVIDQKLDYLMTAADRPVNRFDWKGIALGTVIAIAIQLSLDTERGRQLFELFKQAFAAVLHLLPGS
jgi:hypothetical protein